MKSKGTNTGITLWIKVVFVALSLLLFLFSLTQQAYYVKGSGDSIASYGLLAFLLGWINVYEAGISWLANPILLISWFFMFGRKRKVSTILSILALAFALSFLLFDRIVANEGGGKQNIVGYGIGYLLWVSSCGVNLLGNIVLRFASRRKGS